MSVQAVRTCWSERMRLQRAIYLTERAYCGEKLSENLTFGPLCSEQREPRDFPHIEQINAIRFFGGLEDSFRICDNSADLYRISDDPADLVAESPGLHATQTCFWHLKNMFFTALCLIKSYRIV